MLKLYNTMTGACEKFRPRENNTVKVFTCGPSVYRRPHIGNYRTFIYEDVLVRYLKYLGYKVKRSLILTDIEDKAINEACNKNSSLRELTSEVTQYFFNESEHLSILLPKIIPSSSTTVNTAVKLVKKLLDKEIAYWHNGDVFFDPLKFKDFGKLYKLDMKKWPKKKKRFKKDTYTGRRWNLGDFILWHGHKNDGTVFWDTEIGKGRPAWNIQDPAVIVKYLGFEIDINCGGIDNIYRHHDYNIAVLESISEKKYANFYMHGEHLVVNGKTMSKSRCNILYPENIIKKGFNYKDLRFFLLYTHYRKKLNYRDNTLIKIVKKLDYIKNILKRILSNSSSAKPDNNRKLRVVEITEKLKAQFEECMNDDLNAGRAFDCISILVKKLDSLIKERGDLTRSEIIIIQNLLKKIDTVFCIIL